MKLVKDGVEYNTRNIGNEREAVYAGDLRRTDHTFLGIIGRLAPGQYEIEGTPYGLPYPTKRAAFEAFVAEIVDG